MLTYDVGAVISREIALARGDVKPKISSNRQYRQAIAAIIVGAGTEWPES